jgi:alanine racemase
MNREGIQRKHLDEVLSILKKNRSLRVEGVMSHFANADELDSSFNFKQVNNFKIMLQAIREAGLTPEWSHISNSAGIAKVKDPIFNAARAGLAFYGYNPLHHEDSHYHQMTPLQGAMSVYTTITALQQLEA